MAESVYILCALTAIACSVLLLRGYLAGRSRLLFWSSLCFAGLALNNILLFIDLVIIPTGYDLSLVRNALALVAVMILVFGLVWESQ